jgi:uracil-DNA glycosylase family 4
MSNEPEAKELLELVVDAREYLTYLRELGFEGLDDASGSEQVSATLESMSKAPAADTSRPAQRAALERNAVAVERAATNISHESPALPANPSAGASPSNVDETGMATRKKKFPDEVPPAPQETLFGEVTPQDVESLPRADETLEDIWNDIGICMRCPLCCQGRNKVVNSEGNRKARLMFVGEAPGADEDAQGRPFVGRAGQLLNKIIEAIGLTRDDVFIGNVNRCRPPQNRTPTLAEAAICKPFLLREIAVVRPDVIVVLGNTAMKNLLDTKEGITKLRGKFQDYRGIKVMPTFHPAYLLRDPSKKREAWDDMKKVRDYLKTVTSDR